MICDIAILLLFIAAVHGTPNLVQRVSGEVTAGNYTFYKLTSAGRILLVLASVAGDADLYLSSKTATPTYSLDNHELQSCTCGLDTVEVSSYQKRPVSIGVYGYPQFDLSKYVLSVFVYPDEAEYEWNAASYTADVPDMIRETEKSSLQSAQNENESFLIRFIQVLFSIASVLLEIVFEILL